MMEKIYRVYTGVSVEGKTKDLHPITMVKHAQEILNNKYYGNYYTNSADFVYYLYHYGKKQKEKVILYVDGVESTLEEVFKGWNEALKMK